MVATQHRRDETSVASHTVSAHLDRLLVAAMELAQVAESTIDDHDLASAVVDLSTASAVVEAALTSVADAADRTAVAQRRGERKLATFVLSRSNASGFEVRARIRRAVWLRDFPEFTQAHADGILTVEHLERIRKGLDNHRTHFLLRRDQQTLIDAARTCDFIDFERACDYWKIAADPDGAEPEEQLAKTTFTARRRRDGMVKVDGLLDPLSGQVLLNAWNNKVQQLAVAEDESGVRMSEGRRGALALLDLVAAGAARADGSQPDPLLHIVMSQRVAEDTIRRLAERDLSPLPVSHDDVDRRCELIDGTPIHPHLALVALTIGALQRTVLGAKGRPLEASFATRGFPKWLRHVLLLRSRGRCESDGCDAPFPWLQIDHKTPHSKGGLTAYLNGQVLCRPDNLAKGDR